MFDVQGFGFDRYTHSHRFLILVKLIPSNVWILFRLSVSLVHIYPVKMFLCHRLILHRNWLWTKRYE